MVKLLTYNLFLFTTGGKAKYEFKTAMEVYPRTDYWNNWPCLPIWSAYKEYFSDRQLAVSHPGNTN